MKIYLQVGEYNHGKLGTYKFYIIFDDHFK